MPTEIFHSGIYPSSCAVLTNKRNFLPVCDSKLSKRRAVSLLQLSYLSASGMHHTCFYSPAAEHHRTLAGTHFLSSRGKEAELAWVA